MLKKTAKEQRPGRTAVPSKVDVSTLDEQNCTAIFHDVMRLRGSLQQIAAGAARQLGIKSTEMSILDTLGKFGPLTMGKVAELSFISPTNTTRAVKNLISDQLVERRRSEQSDREVVVSLTAEGRKIFRKSYPHMIHEVNSFLGANLNDSERRTLARLLAKTIRQSGK